jgi:hypothetical protein
MESYKTYCYCFHSEITNFVKCKKVVQCMIDIRLRILLF